MSNEISKNGLEATLKSADTETAATALRWSVQPVDAPPGTQRTAGRPGAGRISGRLPQWTRENRSLPVHG